MTKEFFVQLKVEFSFSSVEFIPFQFLFMTICTMNKCSCTVTFLPDFEKRLRVGAKIRSNLAIMLGITFQVSVRLVKTFQSKEVGG